MSRDRDHEPHDHKGDTSALLHAVKEVADNLSRKGGERMSDDSMKVLGTALNNVSASLQDLNNRFMQHQVDMLSRFATMDVKYAVLVRDVEENSKSFEKALANFNASIEKLVVAENEKKTKSEELKGRVIWTVLEKVITWAFLILLLSQFHFMKQSEKNQQGATNAPTINVPAGP